MNAVERQCIAAFHGSAEIDESAAPVSRHLVDDHVVRFGDAVAHALLGQLSGKFQRRDAREDQLRRMLRE